MDQHPRVTSASPVEEADEAEGDLGPVPELAALDLHQGWVVLEDQRVGEITDMYDDEGDDTDDPDEAHAIVAKFGEDYWISVDISEEDLERTLH